MSLVCTKMCKISAIVAARSGSNVRYTRTTHAKADLIGGRGRLRQREDDADARARARARRGRGLACLPRRLSPLRSRSAIRPADHATRPGLQLHGRDGPAPAPAARGRGDPEAGVPPLRRQLRPAGVPRAAPVCDRRGAARLSHVQHVRPLRRAGIPRSTREPAAALEGRARLLPARLHHRPGARRARPPRGRLRHLHPAPASDGRHGRAVLGARDRLGYRRHPPRQLTCCCAPDCRTPISRM